MKIMIVNEFYYPVQKGGAEVSVQLLAEKIAEMGHQVVVVCSDEKNARDFVNNIAVYRLKCNPFGWNGKSDIHNKMTKFLWHLVDSFNPMVVQKFLDIIEREKPDVIHTNNLAHISCAVWIAAKRMCIPIVHTLRDYNLMCPKRTLWNHHTNCQNRCASCCVLSVFNKFFSKDVKAVVGISEHILQRHLNAGYFLRAQSKVIYNSVNGIVSLQKKEPTFNIGYLGKLHESKGIEELIEAFNAVQTSEYSLLIGGDGDPVYVSKLKSKCLKTKKIVFMGKVNREDFFTKIDLLVVPSIWEEPFGRTVIEPIAANIPVIAAASGGISEILNGYEVGLLYSPNDGRELKRVLGDFINGKTKFDFSQKDRFLARFLSEKIAKEYIDLFESVCFAANRE